MERITSSEHVPDEKRRLAPTKMCFSLKTATYLLKNRLVTHPPIIMEVENDPIVEETSLVGTHSPLPFLWEEE